MEKEAKKIERPKQVPKEAFTSKAESWQVWGVYDKYIKDLEKFCDQIEKERDELKDANILLEKERKRLNSLIEDGITRYYESKQKELQALKGAVREFVKQSELLESTEEMGNVTGSLFSKLKSRTK